MAQPPVPHQSLSSPPSPRLNSWRCTNKSPWSRGCPFFFSTFFSFFSTTFPSCPLSSRALLLELHISTSDSLTQSFLPLLHLLILFRLFLLLLIILVFILLFLLHLFPSSISTSLTQRLATQHLPGVPTFSPNNPAQPTSNHKQRCSYCKSKLKNLSFQNPAPSSTNSEPQTQPKITTKPIDDNS